MMCTVISPKVKNGKRVMKSVNSCAGSCQKTIRAPSSMKSLASASSSCFVSIVGVPLPDACHWIRRKRRIAADHRHLLDHRLGNDEPIERITVMERQARQDRRMLECNRQNDETVLHDTLLHEGLIGL